MRVTILEHAVVNQRQTIDVLLSFQKMQASLAAQFPPPPSPPVPHIPTAAVSQTSGALGGGGDGTQPPAAAPQSTTESKHDTDASVSPGACLFLNRTRWAV